MKRHLAAGFFILCCLFSSAGNANADTLAERDGTVSQKLEAIEQKQDEILKRLEEIKTELNVVKIRASLKS